MSDVFPVFLKLKGRRCLVIGGGAVGARKVRALLDAGADVTVVSPELNAGIERLVEGGEVRALRREFRAGDLQGFVLVVETTGAEGVARRVAAEARDRGVLLNTADVPELCDFYFPSILRRGDLVLAACTSGVAPLLSARIRRRWEREFGKAYAPFLAAYARFRVALRARYPEDAGRRRRLLEAVLDSGLLDNAEGRDPEWLYQRMVEWIS